MTLAPGSSCSTDLGSSYLNQIPTFTIMGEMQIKDPRSVLGKHPTTQGGIPPTCLMRNIPQRMSANATDGGVWVNTHVSVTCCWQVETTYVTSAVGIRVLAGGDYICYQCGRYQGVGICVVLDWIVFHSFA